MEIKKDRKTEQITIITTTGIHLSRGIGEALKHAYQGDLTISYDAENYVRVSWKR